VPPRRSVSGIAKFDKLAVEYPEELQAFLQLAEENGWITKATDRLTADSPAFFFPRKARFYYDPERMTYLDLLHERKHLEIFIARGHWKVGKAKVLLFQDEIAAYSHELEILRREGGARADYVEYLEGQVARYRFLVGEGPDPVRPSTMPDPFFKRPGP
jgi:hypothetical protein